MPFEDDLISIMHAGVLAPSADNRHCFRFQATDDGIGLHVGDDYVGAPFHRKTLHRISLGAVVENMVVRAACLGYTAEAEWLPEPEAPGLVAYLRLRAAPPVDHPLDVAIERRHTNRRLWYAGPALQPEALAGFGRLIADIPGVSLSFFDAEPQRSQLLRLMWLAESERFAVKSMHEDLFSAVRFDVGWHTSAAEGLPPGALAIEPGMRWAFAQLRHWPLMNVLRLVGVHKLLGLRAAYLPARLAPHRGVLSTERPLHEGAPAVGRALQRIWLEAARLELAMQPLAGAALLALADYREVGQATRELLRQGWAALTDQTPLLVLRLGHASTPDVRTGRPSLDHALRAGIDS